MTTFKAGTLFVDLSSNNPAPDLPAHYAAGYRLIALKFTQGTGYVWSQGITLAQQAIDLGFTVIKYHFASPGSSGADQAAFFLENKHPEAVWALDVEGSGWGHLEANTVSHDFCAAMPAGSRGLQYVGAYFAPANGMTLPANADWWVPAYGQDAPPEAPAGYKSPAVWQNQDNAVVAGMPAPVDQSRLMLDWTPQTGSSDDMLTIADVTTGCLSALNTAKVAGQTSWAGIVASTLATAQNTFNAVGKVGQQLTALQASVDKLSAGGATIDYAALAKAVNDDAAKRMQA